MKTRIFRLLWCPILLIVSLFLAVSVSAGFSDIPDNAWYAADVDAAVESGLINGKSANAFCPDDELTAAEAIKLAACLHQKLTTGTVTLQNGDPWYKPYVEYGVKNEIFSLLSHSQSPNPNANPMSITRMMFMKLLTRALPEDFLTPINTVEDNTIPDISLADDTAPEIYTLYRAGIVQGTGAAHACTPYERIKRSEVAAILNRVLHKEKRLSFTMQLDMENQTYNGQKVVCQRKEVPTDSFWNAKYEWIFTEDGTMYIKGSYMEYEYAYNGSGVMILDDGSYDIFFSYAYRFIRDFRPWRAYLSQIKKVVFEDGITYIGINAFYDCPNLETVEMTDSVKTISDSAFLNCQNLSSIHLSENITKIGVFCFEGTAFTSFCFPPLLERVSTGVMSKCKNLAEVILPEGLKYIGYFSFEDCPKLTSVLIPATVTHIATHAFTNDDFSVKALYFLGDAPRISLFPENWEDKPKPTFYYISGKSGWTSPTYTDADGHVYNTKTWTP